MNVAQMLRVGMRYLDLRHSLRRDVYHAFFGKLVHLGNDLGKGKKCSNPKVTQSVHFSRILYQSLRVWEFGKRYNRKAIAEVSCFQGGRYDEL